MWYSASTKSSPLAFVFDLGVSVAAKCEQKLT